MTKYTPRKYKVQKTFNQKNRNLINEQVYKLVCWQSRKFLKQQNNKISICWQNDNSAKCQVDEVLRHRFYFFWWKSFSNVCISSFLSFRPLFKQVSLLWLSLQTVIALMAFYLLVLAPFPLVYVPYESCLLIEGRHDTLHNSTQYKDIQHNDSQHKVPICDTQHNNALLSVAFHLLPCWMPSCLMSLC